MRAAGGEHPWSRATDIGQVPPMPCLHLGVAPGWMHRIAAASTAGCLVLPMRLEAIGPGGSVARLEDRARVLGLGVEDGTRERGASLLYEAPGVPLLHAVRAL